MLLVGGAHQACLQLVGGEGLDQVVVRSKLGQGDDIGVGALAGDDDVYRAGGDQVGVAQFFQQLLTIAAVIEDEVGQDDVEAVGFDLTDDFGRIAGTVDLRDAQGAEHQPHRFACRCMPVHNQDTFFGQRLLQDEEHFLVFKRFSGFRTVGLHGQQITVSMAGEQEKFRLERLAPGAFCVFPVT